MMEEFNIQGKQTSFYKYCPGTFGYTLVVTEQMHQNCSGMCTFPNLFITFYFTGHPETETRFQKLMALPAVHTIVFDNVGWKSEVKIQPHRGCFLNSLDICITNMARWTVTCCMQCEVRLAVLQIHNISGCSGIFHTRL